MLQAMLLIVAGDIQLNPGPSALRNTRNTKSARSPLKFTVFNIWSAVNKAASLQSLINDYDFYVIALTETWIACDVPPAIMNDVDRVGYSVLHIHRALVPDGPSCGGCLAIIHRNSSDPGTPSTHERQIVRIVGTWTSTVVTVVNIYRPPSGSISQILIKLGDLLSILISRSTDRLIF